MSEQTSIEYGGIRIDLAHVHETSRRTMLAEAQAWIDGGQRPPLLTVRNGGVDVSTRPHLWPEAERNYRGPGLRCPRTRGRGPATVGGTPWLAR